MEEKKQNHMTEKPAAVIFDMDGVLVDSNPFHLKKWQDFLTAHNVPFDPAELPSQIFGAHNDAAFSLFFGDKLTAEKRRELAEELEATFRKTFKAHAAPLPGLEELLKSLKASGIPMAVASSAMMKNVQFVVDSLGFHDYFPVCVSGDDVRHPKPDAEIYLKTADRLGVAPESCVAFEDSFVGIESAKAARMKCVAIASSFSFEDLQQQTQADLVIRSFSDINLARLRRLFS